MGKYLFIAHPIVFQYLSVEATSITHFQCRYLLLILCTPVVIGRGDEYNPILMLVVMAHPIVVLEYVFVGSG